MAMKKQITEITSVDLSANGSIDSQTTNIKTFDKDDHLLTRLDRTKAHGKLYSKEKEVHSYDSQGNLLRYYYQTESKRISYDDYRTETVNVYDEQNNVLSTTIKLDRDYHSGALDSNYDTVDQVTNTYDASGNLLTSLNTQGSDSKGIIWSWDKTENTYDQQGNLLTTLWTYDREVDGNPEIWRKTTNTYDADNNCLTTSVEDYDNNSVIASTQLFTRTYDRKNNLRARTHEIDRGADGIADYQKTSTWMYDRDGNVLMSAREKDLGVNGSIDYRRKIVNTYDREGRLIHYVYKLDSDGDGVIDRRDEITNTYGGTHLISSIVKRSYNGDGHIDYRQTQTDTYQGRHLLTSLLERDYNGDDRIDYQETRTNTYKNNELVSIFKQDYTAHYIADYWQKDHYIYNRSGDRPITWIQKIRSNGIPGIDFQMHTDYTYSRVPSDGLGTSIHSPSANDLNTDLMKQGLSGLSVLSGLQDSDLL